MQGRKLQGRCAAARHRPGGVRLMAIVVIVHEEVVSTKTARGFGFLYARIANNVRIDADQTSERLVSGYTGLLSSSFGQSRAR